MFATKRWLIAMICIVGFLVTSLGMYEAFRPKQAEADCSTIGRVHRDPLVWTTHQGGRWTGNKRDTAQKVNCSRCQGYPKSTHKEKEWEDEYDLVNLWDHRWFWSSNWTYCHNHAVTMFVPTWYLVRCNKSGGGNN